MSMRIKPPVHPGEIMSVFLADYSLTPYALAKALHIPRTRIERVVRKEWGITGDTALRLARYFGTTPEYWMNLQTGYELGTVAEEKAADIEAIEPRAANAACAGAS